MNVVSYYYIIAQGACIGALLLRPTLDARGSSERRTDKVRTEHTTLLCTAPERCGDRQGFQGMRQPGFSNSTHGEVFAGQAE